ncbi:MAG: 3'-5' exonuclease, partial [Gemmatimonadales bacterium]
MTAHLLRKAERLLEDGPQPAGEVARRVLGLQGPSPLLERAVDSLLGPDSRFRVEEGQWSFTDSFPPAPSPESPLSALGWAVVDVETTGGSHGGADRITEVAIVAVEEGRISDRWSSLVNPRRPIPQRICSLTGITDEMVARAPEFHQLVPEVEARLAGRVFVAHNASFDWGFIRSELLRATGDVPELPRLCTVKVGRRLVPESPRHSLDALSEHLGIG